MPSYPLLLGVPEYAESLMRAFGLKGDLPREIVPEFQVGFQLADLQAPDFQYLKRSLLWQRGSSQGAVAGEFPIAAFLTRVAAQSRTNMAIVDQVSIVNQSAATVTYLVGLTIAGTGIGDPGAANVVAPRDDRAFAGAQESAYAVSTGSNAVNPGTGIGAFLVDIPAGAYQVITGPWILTNFSNALFRSALLVVGNTVNTAMRVNFWWREREVHSSEL